MRLVSAQSDVRAQFGRRLKELRRAAGLTQEALADASDLNRTYVGSVERGERNVSLVNIHRLAAALNVPPEQLLVHG